MEDDIELTIGRKYLKEHVDSSATGEKAFSVITTVFPYEVKNVKIDIPAKDKEYVDKILICKTCGQQFIFSAQAQKNYDLKGWCAPKRCKKCRHKNPVKKNLNCVIQIGMR